MFVCSIMNIAFQINNYNVIWIFKMQCCTWQNQTYPIYLHVNKYNFNIVFGIVICWFHWTLAFWYIQIKDHQKCIEWKLLFYHLLAKTLDNNMTENVLTENWNIHSSRNLSNRKMQNLIRTFCQLSDASKFLTEPCSCVRFRLRFFH